MSRDALGVVADVAARPRSARAGGNGNGGGAGTQLANNAALLRALSWPLLRLRPIVVTRERVLVTRHADVCEVLARDEDLTIAEVNAARMAVVNGPFVLGMDRSELYLHERGLLERCVATGDRERIRTTVRELAAEAVTAAAPAGRLDVVQQLARPVAAGLVASYFGVAGPDTTTMLRWMRALFHETFLNLAADPAVRQAGEAAGEELHAHVDDLIALRRSQLLAGEPTPEDFLTRLVRLQDEPGSHLSDEGVRRNIGGVIVGAVETTAKAVAHSLAELLSRPEQWQAARDAARVGDLEAVGRYAFEALRFNPVTPVLVRHAARDVVLAAGTRRERLVPAGRKVYAAALSAMFDPDVFPRPNRFRSDRPAASYLHFGAGLHACFGRYVNGIQIPELVAAVLRLDGVRPQHPRRPWITYDGPFPDRFPVLFEGGG